MKHSLSNRCRSTFCSSSAFVLHESFLLTGEHSQLGSLPYQLKSQGQIQPKLQPGLKQRGGPHLVPRGTVVLRQEELPAPSCMD